MLVDGSYEVWRVAKVMLTEVLRSHVCQVISIENQIISREILEKIHSRDPGHEARGTEENVAGAGLQTEHH